MIHISHVHNLVEKGEFSIRFVKRNGEIVEAKRAICTSFFSNGTTMNIKFCDSNQIRKVRRVAITHINNEEVVL
jgi:hypothetical protein